MKKLILTIVAIVLTFAFQTPVHADEVHLPKAPSVGSDGVYAAHNAPSSVSPRVKCTGESRVDEEHKNDGSTGDDEWWFKMITLYDWCHNTRHPHRPWADPAFTIYGYNQEGSHMSCNVLMGNNVLRYVAFNPYFFDFDGHSMNPPPVYVPCDESTHNSETQYYPGETRLHRVHTFDPRQRVPYKVHKGGHYEPEGTLAVALRHCSGAGLKKCA